MIKIKRFFALLLIILACAGLVACAKKEAAFTTTPPRAELGPPVIGVIYPGTYDVPNTYSNYHHQQLCLAMKRTGMDSETQLFTAENVASDRESVRTAVQGLVEQGANVIFSTEFNYSFHMLEIAEDYPGTVFCQLGGTERNGQNLVDYFGELYKAYYIAGTVAGQKSLSEETNAIGFVSAYGLENPDAVSCINAFAQGVRYTNPEASVYLKVLDAPGDGQQEEAAAKELVAQYGCSILAQYTNTDITLTTAEYLGIPACGPYFDADDQAPGSILVSPLFNGYTFYREAIKAAQNATYADQFGTRLGTARYYPSGIGGSFADMVAMSKKEDELPGELGWELGRAHRYMEDCAPTDPADPQYNEDYVMRAEGIFSGQFYKRIDKNSSQILEADLLDNTGRVIVPAGAVSLTTDEIRSMDFYLEGITVVTDAP